MDASNTVRATAFNTALALESLPDDLKTMNIPAEILVCFARTVAYKVFHNLKHGFQMSKEDDPLSVDGVAASTAWADHYEV